MRGKEYRLSHYSEIITHWMEMSRKKFNFFELFFFRQYKQQHRLLYQVEDNTDTHLHKIHDEHVVLVLFLKLSNLRWDLVDEDF